MIINELTYNTAQNAITWYAQDSNHSRTLTLTTLNVILGHFKYNPSRNISLLKLIIDSRQISEVTDGDMRLNNAASDEINRL